MIRAFEGIMPRLAEDRGRRSDEHRIAASPAGDQAQKFAHAEEDGGEDRIERLPPLPQ